METSPSGLWKPDTSGAAFMRDYHQRDIRKRAMDYGLLLITSHVVQPGLRPAKPNVLPKVVWRSFGSDSAQAMRQPARRLKTFACRLFRTQYWAFASACSFADCWRIGDDSARPTAMDDQHIGRAPRIAE